MWRPDAPPAGPGAPRGAIGATDVTHYRLELEILPQLDEEHEVSAVAVQGTNGVDAIVVGAALNTFELDLVDDMTVVSVTGDVSGWLHSDDRIQISLDRIYQPGEAFHVDVSYQGVPDTGGFGAFQWWMRNGNLAVATLSEPYFSPLWWPCKDSLSDKSTMQMIVTVPDPMVVASNGILESVTPLAGGRTRFNWHEVNPMANYLASLAITNYELYELQYEYDDGHGGLGMMPVPCYVYPDHWNYNTGQPLAQDKAGCDEMLTMLSVFEDVLGPYAFRNEKYGVAETGGTGGLQSNMEHQTISSMYRVRNYTDIMSHEMAHHWFGDDVTCATWHDIWLNEGLSSYAEALYHEFRPGGGAGSFWGRMNSRRPANPNARVYRTSIGSVGAIFSTNDIYNKGAWVTHMLRHVMGDAAFFQAILDYRAAYADGFATTADFIGVVSQSFGHDLTWFTDQWVMQPGAPDYRWRYELALVDGERYLKLRIRQVQNFEGFGLIQMPVDIRITTTQGATVHRVWNDNWFEHYVIPVDAEVTNVEFDESGGVASRNYILASSVEPDAAPLSAPPVVLQVETTAYAPTPGESTVRVVFSENIGALDGADVSLVGASTGAQLAQSMAYNAASQSALITFADLPNDTFTLTLHADGITANGLALDGEIEAAAWYDDTLLPSGDGQPGGDAVILFETHAGDADCDGVVDMADLAPFVAALLGLDGDACHQLRSDINNDGLVDGLDVQPFIAALINP